MDAVDVLPSWNDSEIKEKIIGFAESASDPRNASFVPVEERIAVMDFDGTLALENRGIAVPGWVETELFRHLILERFRAEAASGEAHPALDTMRGYYRYTEETVHAKTLPFREDVYWDYYFKMIAYGVEGLTIGETCDLLSRQMHKTYYDDKTFFQALFRPMVELAKYLMTLGFEFFIVSGSNRSAIYTVAKDLLRMEDRTFPYSHCIGADLELKPVVLEDGGIRMEQTTDYAGINMHFDKCENIARQIGRIPILAVGNGSGDFEMLRWTGMNPKHPSMSVIVLHDDAEREYCYNVGIMLEEARKNGWETVSMKDDLRELYL